MATASVVGGGEKQTGVPQETHQQSPTDSILDDYTTKFQKRLDALLKRHDVEIDKVVATAKEHPLFKEYAKITCENAGIDEDDFQFGEHEILEEYVDWELWLEGRSSASTPRVDVATPKATAHAPSPPIVAPATTGIEASIPSPQVAEGMHEAPVETVVAERGTSTVETPKPPSLESPEEKSGLKYLNVPKNKNMHNASNLDGMKTVPPAPATVPDPKLKATPATPPSNSTPAETQVLPGDL